MLAQRISFIGMLTLVTIAFVAILLPFYSAVLWAVIFAIIMFPIHVRIERRIAGYPNSAAALSVIMCLCLVIIPGLAVLSSLVQQAGHLYQQVETGELDIAAIWASFTEALPAFARSRIDQIDAGSFNKLREQISSAVLEGGGFFAGQALTFGQNALRLIVGFGIMLYLLFFLFRDGRDLASTVRRAVPLSDDHTRQFARKFTSVVRATVRGNVIIAMIQGAIGGIAFWALGLQPALLWGVAMSLLSLLPAVGAAIIWFPAAVYLAVSGLWWQAVILSLVGVFLIGLVDNLLRPRLVGQETKLPDYVVLISTVGGIALLGINGFVIGPLVAALFISAWSIFVRERHFPEDENAVSEPATPMAAPT